MTLTMELDDQTPLDATDVRAALVAQRADARVIVHLKHDNGNELLVGFRGDRGVCLWQPDEGDGEVTTGGSNEEVMVYGWAGVPFPPGSEIDGDTVIDAAEEFATTGARPTCVTWTDYHGAMPLEGSTITPEELQALLRETDGER
ncbi:Immunity protein Imm1 [Saccharopolyspora antimicrobica]|uniref:Immunity protein Imm1 n=1 Tax=Saccharopolyspora antimicrobica TaxID=455193 RepID=A0A1I4VG61_9PSEU|nr:Imm1 family immunity protein [Saccharopolyspora antimicrobica]RKT86285.1 immunity protein Imm1 of predicted polymorphic toxin system [Saccharopolyspora antimicrobica]SFN00073.1 Immunity protein Imm1 [Saccharopolyspora antimicrobica]